MRLAVIPKTLLVLVVIFGITDAQGTKGKKQRQRQKPQAKVDRDTDPGDLGGLSDEALKNAGIGSLDPDNPANDPVQTGQRLVIQGMDMQLSALAASVRATDNADLRKQRLAELRDTVRVKVELRKRYLKQRITRLEKLVATLRKEVERKDSVDLLVKQLLSKPVEPEPGVDAPEDPAAADPGGDADVAAETDPDNPKQDPAEKKTPAKAK